jgi:glutathione reductase (NADPH)
MKQDVDLFVIGGGSAGVRAARTAAELGASVMLAEESRVGGTCVIRGCVPKKLMMYASQVGADVEAAEGFGWTIPSRSFDWRKLKNNRDREVARLEAAYAAGLRSAGVAVVHARAELLCAGVVRLSTGATVHAKHTIIATGGLPAYGAGIEGLEHVISSDGVFNLNDLPSSIVIFGGGYIGVELASIFAGLGSRVTVVHRGAGILRDFDDEIGLHVLTEMEAQGITFVANTTVDKVTKSEGRLEVHLSNASSRTCDQVLFALGRKPNVVGLGLERVGVKLDPTTGGILVDEHSQTTVPNTFAVGDVTNRFTLTPVAIREGQAVAERIFGSGRDVLDYSAIPTAVFSQPQVGSVGLTESEAQEIHGDVRVYSTKFRPMKGALSGSHSRIFMKLIVHGLSDRILGCHIVSPEAAELTQIVAVCIKMKATKSDLDSVFPLHPTAAEELVTMRRPARVHASG